MNIDLQKIVGKNYNRFWHSKKRYVVCKGSRGSKKSTTTALKYIYLIMYYFHNYNLKPNLLVIRRYMNTSLVRYMQVKDIIYRDYTRLNMKLIDEYELNLYFMFNNIIHLVNKYYKQCISFIPLHTFLSLFFFSHIHKKEKKEKGK